MSLPEALDFGRNKVIASSEVTGHGLGRTERVIFTDGTGVELVSWPSKEYSTLTWEDGDFVIWVLEP